MFYKNTFSKNNAYFLRELRYNESQYKKHLFFLSFCFSKEKVFLPLQKKFDMAYCKNCGTFLEDNVRFCPKCGVQIEKTIEEQPFIENPYAYKQEPQQKPPMPNTYLWQSIVVTIVCCLVLGIPAIVYATQVETKYSAGDYEGAFRSSKYAKNFCIWSLVSSVIIGIFYFILALVGVVGSLGSALY
jgi:predicted secreted protein